MERPQLKLVEPLEPANFETPIVRELPPRPPRGFSLRHLQAIQTLPDNVYLLPRTPSLDPDIA